MNDVTACVVVDRRKVNCPLMVASSSSLRIPIGLSTYNAFTASLVSSVALALPRFPDYDLVLVAPYGVCPLTQERIQGVRLGPTDGALCCVDLVQRRYTQDGW